MKLTALYLEGFRRFESETKLDLGPKVVALVGPNEAGKSSVLVAMTQLNTGSELDSQFQSRGSQRKVSVEAHFVLEGGDWDALNEVPGGRAIRRYTYERRLISGRTRSYYSLVPSPKRDLSGRKATAKELEGFVHREDIRRRHQSAMNKQVSEVLDAAAAALASDEDSLDKGQIENIRMFAEVMFAFPNLQPSENSEPQTDTVTEEFVVFLQGLRSYDEGESPSDRAAQILGERRPEFLTFTEDDRNLNSVYNLSELADQPPRALANLAGLADLDLRQLRAKSEPTYAGERTTMLNRANRRLSERFAHLWPQHELTVQLGFNAPNLEITVSSPGDTFTGITERSDGLRSFIALRAFLAVKGSGPVKPILLVDEAETHLHYDAQANLIDMFTKQELVAKVIYTTHSAGCLPMDLGHGIRVVAPIEGKERSNVRKSIWDGRFAGFSPLVFAMGATTFAFLPSRNVLIVEGESDAILLPTLLRESGGLETLRFQIAPGLSVVSQLSASVLKTEGSSVLYLTDGDQGGEELRKQLTDAEVRKSDIFSLKDAFADNWVLEDLVNPKHYVDAVNWVIETFLPIGTPKVTSDDISSPKCTQSLKSWCKAYGVKEPDRVVVAQRLLDIKFEGREDGSSVTLLSASSKTKLNRLLTKMAKRFPEAPEYNI